MSKRWFSSELVASVLYRATGKHLAGSLLPHRVTPAMLLNNTGGSIMKRVHGIEIPEKKADKVRYVLDHNINGGPLDVCRFTGSRSRWMGFDGEEYGRLTQETPEAFIKRSQKRFEVNVLALKYLKKPTGKFAEHNEFRLVEVGDEYIHYSPTGGHFRIDTRTEADHSQPDALKDYRWCLPREESTKSDWWSTRTITCIENEVDELHREVMAMIE